MRSLKRFGLVAFAWIAAGLVCSTGAALAQESTAPQIEAIHNELRAVRDRAVAAMKDRNPDALMAELTDDIAFTAMNNEVVHGKEAAKAYYQRMMDGASRIVEDMSVTIEPDILSNLHNSGESAISTGDSVAYFKIRGGLEFTAPLRWTASLVHDNGAWKIAAMHFSSNIFDNPVEAGISKYLWLMLSVAGLVGLAVGFVLARVRRRA